MNIVEEVIAMVVEVGKFEEEIAIVHSEGSFSDT